MFTFSVILFMLGYILHIAYDNMPYNLYEKIGDYVKRASYVLPAIAFIGIAGSSLFPTPAAEVQAYEPSVDVTSLEAKIDAIAADVDDIRSLATSTSEQLNTYSDDLESYKSGVDKKLSGLEKSLKKAAEAEEEAKRKEAEKAEAAAKKKAEEEAAAKKKAEEEAAAKKKAEEEAAAARKKAEKEKSATTDSSATKVYFPSGLYLRESADGDSTVLTTVPAGTTCSYLGETSGWYKVSYNGKTGWVSKRLSQKK